MQVLILLAALSTCDPGNILDTIAAAKQAKVRVSVIGLAADVHICDKIAQVLPAFHRQPDWCTPAITAEQHGCGCIQTTDMTGLAAQLVCEDSSIKGSKAPHSAMSLTQGQQGAGSNLTSCGS